MGKSNRIRANRANVKAQNKAPGVKKKSQGMPSWLMTLITLVITFAVLLSIAFSLLSANGVFGRWRTPLSTENYKVSNNMLSYYFYTQYQAFQQNYGSNMSSFSLDTSKSLKDQYLTEQERVAFSNSLPENFSGTWFDLFMYQTVEGTKSLLLFCEEADARNITLSDEEKQEIQASLDTMENTAATYGYTLNSYISMTYGPGVRTSDVRKAMTYSALAAKCMDAITEELDQAISSDRVSAKYEENKLDFNVVDFTYYTFRVDYDDIVTEELGSDVKASELNDEQKAKVLEAYKKAIAQAKADAEALKAKTTEEEFMNFILDYAAKKAIDDTYADQTVADTDKPTDADLTAIKEALKADILAEIAEGKEKADAAVTVEENATSVTVYEKTVTAGFAKVLNTVKEKVFTSVKSTKNTSTMDTINYVEDDEFATWAFADGRVAGERTVIVTGDGKEEGEVTKKDGYSYVNVYYLRNAQYKNVQKTKDVAYMLFGTADAAKAAIEKLNAKGTMDLATFEAMATELSSTGHTHMENYAKGELGSDAFDKWVFADDTTVGKLTAEPIELDEKNFAVVFYYAEGDEKWYVDVHNTLLSEDYDKFIEAMEVKYPVTAKEKTWNKIEA